MKTKSFSRQITGSDGHSIGYIRGNSVYDVFGERVLGLNSSAEHRVKYVVSIATNEIVGIYDGKNGNIFDTQKNFIGSVGTRGVHFPAWVLLLTVFLVIVSTYCLTSLQKSAQDTGEDEPIVIICMPTTEGEPDWSQNNTLNIFSEGKRLLPDGTTESYDLNGGICPYDQGEYGFVLSNENARTITYCITLSTDNEFNIPVKFKLKMGGEYVAGGDNEWLDVSEFMIDDLRLTKNSVMQFELIWLWDGSDNELDSYIGSQELAEYQLTITLSSSYAEL